MSAIFVILFLAALVGIVRPYLGTLRRGHFAVAAGILFVLIGVSASKETDKTKPVPQAIAEIRPAAVQPIPSEESKPKIAASKWEYSQDKDEMRGTTTRYATLQSNNEVDLDFLYGSVYGKIWIRKRPEDGLNIMFAVDKGQILCHSFGDSFVSMKFDSGPIQRFRCTSASDGSSETAFIQNTAAVLAKIKKAKRVVIEAEFYQKGRQQFVFETAGFEW